uniref:Palmitoyltransferase n=1 Tax=Periophthalmus magnuspinnatus TaxID=409849 RepID=A0A3B3ZU45_9GOBI
MKWEKLKPPEPDDPMCCCECDVSQCCDCEDLDEAFNRHLKCGFQSPVLQAITENLEISMIPALVLLPLLLRIAALHFLLGVTVLTILPILVLWYYYATHQKKRRTLFFLTLALYSLAYMYYLFITEILPRGDVSHIQLCTVTTGMILTIVSLINTKRGPGFVTPDLYDTHKHDKHERIEVNGDVKTTKKSNIGQWVQCPVCKIMRPPRAGHCRTCGACVLRLDHHCIWINSCVGQANHRSFLMTLGLFLVTSVYGMSLVLHSICPGHYVLTAAFYCPGVYAQFSTALCFTCVWYSGIITAGLFYLMVVQLLNISFNVTEREAQLALRRGTGHWRLCGLILVTGEHSHGFTHNWLEFLTMTHGSSQSTQTDLV